MSLRGGETVRAIMACVVLILYMLLLRISSTQSGYLDPSVLGCGQDIDYPFGVPGLSRNEPMTGFEVYCDGGGNILTLRLGSATVPVIEISSNGYVRVELGPVNWACSHSSINSGGTATQRGLALAGTPYSFNNTRNKFTVIGYDGLVTLRPLTGGTITNHTSGEATLHAPNGDTNTITGCSTFCIGTNTNVIGGSCSGVGCCQSLVPTGLKGFSLNFESICKESQSKEAPVWRCTQAYILEDEEFTFGGLRDLRGSAVGVARPVVLDWAIGNETCDAARRRSGNSSTACKAEDSYCYDAPSGGYRCNCSDGYTGNPYLMNGCQDIDECLKNPCKHKCINVQGGYNCTCPWGFTGDGQIEGSGCKRDRLLAISLVTGLGLLCLVLLGTLWYYCSFEKRKASKLKEKFFMQNGGLLLQQHISARQGAARIFSEEELEMATNNFDEERVVGRGGYGTVYKGTLSDQRVVAIKKAKLVDSTQIEQFINEVVVLSQIHHDNVVKLLGCCLETQVPLLIYEFISNDTLFHHLHSSGLASSLPWWIRLRIAVETAGALAYLHCLPQVPIIHRDIKSSNILLDENLTAKVSDFGASRLVPCNQTHVTTLVQGTMGYLDPEYFQTSQLTEKSDVYSFGVVLLELITREHPLSFSRPESARNLASHFILLLKENRLVEVLDKQVVKEAGMRHLSEVAQLAKRCLSMKGEERPSMKAVVVELNALLRLLKQHSTEKRQEGMTSSAMPQRTCGYEEAEQSTRESHMSSDDSRLYSMENQLLATMDFPR